MKQNKIISALIALTALSSVLASTALASDEVKVFVNNEQLVFPNEQPYIDLNRTMAPFSTDTTMVPLRAVFEKLGCTVTWDDETKFASIKTKYNEEIRIRDGCIDYSVPGEGEESNSCMILADKQPVNINGSLMIPLRLVSELAGAKVSWDGKSRSVYIGETEADEIMFSEALLEIMSENCMCTQDNYVADIDRDGKLEYVMVSAKGKGCWTAIICDGDSNGMNFGTSKEKDIYKEYEECHTVEELIEFLND